jgi:hypothetical protein
MKSLSAKIVGLVGSLMLLLGVGVFAAAPASAHTADYCGHGTKAAGWFSSYSQTFEKSWRDNDLHWHTIRSKNVFTGVSHLDYKICGRYSLAGVLNHY